MVQETTMLERGVTPTTEKAALTRSGDKGQFFANKTLTTSTCNPYIKTFKAMEYAARGPVIMRAMQIEAELRSGVKKPFRQVIKANLGDAHAMGQKPLSFVRQVLALVACPDLLETSDFPEDVKLKARSVLAQCRGGSVGAYTDSRGLEVVRKCVADYIERRDGIPSDPDNIVVTAGASEGIRSCLKLFKGVEGAEKRSGVLVPVPEYPLYSATLGEYNIAKINYYLDESDGWGLSRVELERALTEGRKVADPRAIVIINPGNPTGQVLTRSNMEQVIRFAYEERLFILADEVYQDNVYAEAEFVSFKKVLSQMPAPYNQVELVSFYSCSKGFVCECGLRGAYFECTNMDPEVKSVLLATAAAKLCPTVLGQAAVACSVDPPRPGDPSYAAFRYEKDNILNGFGERARLVTEVFNSIPFMSCSPVQGALYAFPNVQLPPSAINAAMRLGQEPDVFYALELLEETGICVVPGSGIGQKEGTFHFRTTILPETSQLVDMLDRFKIFHLNFIKKYATLET